MAAEGKIDPMHQFTVEPIAPLHIGPYDISFTTSSLWLLVALALIFGFMALGMKRELVPGRWQMAVEGVTGFIDDMVKVNIGPKGKSFVPYIFSLFMFILVVEPARPAAAGGHSAFTRSRRPAISASPACSRS